jgi:hypothetical protein
MRVRYGFDEKMVRVGVERVGSAAAAAAATSNSCRPGRRGPWRRCSRPSTSTPVREACRLERHSRRPIPRSSGHALTRPSPAPHWLWTKPSMAFVHLADRSIRRPKAQPRQSRGFRRSAVAASCGGRLVPQSAHSLWTKPSMAFVHLADRSKSRGFRRSAVAASCGGRLVPQSAKPDLR